MHLLFMRQCLIVLLRCHHSSRLHSIEFLLLSGLVGRQLLLCTHGGYAWVFALGRAGFVSFLCGVHH